LTNRKSHKRLRSHMQTKSGHMQMRTNLIEKRSEKMTYSDEKTDPMIGRFCGEIKLTVSGLRSPILIQMNTK